MKTRPKNTSTGLNKEKEVVSWLKRHHFIINYEGGKGPADIEATDLHGRHWFIQVKYTRKREMSSKRFKKELHLLIQTAEEKHGTAVLCFVVQKSMWFVSAKTYKTLKRGFFTKLINIFNMQFDYYRCLLIN